MKVDFIFIILVMMVFFFKSSLFSMEKKFDPKKNKNNVLVNIKKVNPTILVDMRYATDNNILGKIIYYFGECYLRPEVAQALSDVQNELSEIGYGLKIWDAYRPITVHHRFLKMAEGIINLSLNDCHSKGYSVDVTLVDLKNNKRVSMPTDFDDTSFKAWSVYNQNSKEEEVNLRILQFVMQKHGFVGCIHKWWHFDYKKVRKDSILNIPFEELQIRDTGIVKII